MKKGRTKKKVKTPAQIRDRYLRKKYGISLKEYNQMLKAQGGVCAICKRPPKTLSLSVDHDHKLKYLRTQAQLLNDRWEVAPLAFLTVRGYGKTKRLAVRDLRERLKRVSVRGLLCHLCNVGLRKYSDDPVRMTNAAEYLYKFKEKMGV